MKKLTEYQQKRNFTKTKEPKGKITKKSQKIFVIQYHQSKRPHYDFRLEHRGVLLSWAIPKGPSLNPKVKRLAVQVEDHPYDYKDFEGTIPQGEYGAGDVHIFDSGVYEEITSINKGLKDGMIKFCLRGKRIQGNFALVKMNDNNWLLIKEKDEYCTIKNILKDYEQQIDMKRKIILNQQIKNQKLLNFQFELALLHEDIPSESGWLYEIKYDGYRILSVIQDGNIKMLTRNKKDYTAKFPSIAQNLLKLSKGKTMILDGEIVHFSNQGKSDFSALQDDLKNKNDENLDYVVFDCLYFDKKDLRDTPLIKRKELLKSILSTKVENIRYSEHIENHAKEFYQKVKENKLEGIIGKRKDSKYLGRRSGNWIKIKCRQSHEFVIGGYVLSDTKARKIKSLLLGEYNGNNLIYRGKVGSGITQNEDLLKIFVKYIRKTSPFKDKIDENAIYLTPKLIAEIEYQEITKSGHVRQASFKTIRSDKSTQEVHDEVIEISSKEKILYPKLKVKKIDIANYYLLVAEKMLPFIQNRPLSVLRAHQNVNSTYMKRHPDSNIGIGIEKFTLSSKGDRNEYFSIQDVSGILQEVQNGTIEFHIWGANKNDINHPNYMVFDLDPDENLPISKLRRGVKLLKDILDKFNLKSFLKTSGKKGYHVVIPFKNNVTWDKFSKFSLEVATLLEEKYENIFTTNIRKDKRKNKIFIDWLRNKKMSTSVAPYSLRTNEKAGISCPIAWNQLNKIKPDSITIKNVKKYLKLNPWKNFLSVSKTQTLK